MIDGLEVLRVQNEVSPGTKTILVTAYGSNQINSTLKGYLSSADTLVFEISDTGIGIPEGMDVFEIFRTTKPDGTGLGPASGQPNSFSSPRRD